MQTTARDIRAGWRYFRSWKQRFWLSTRRGRGLEPKESRDIVHLADHDQIRHLELYDEIDLDCNLEDSRDQKIAFMQAYLSVAALESRHFERQARLLLNLQSRLRAPSVLGFWFWQSDIAKFGAGVSPFFQGEKISIFCEHVKQIDFADTFAILPFDQIAVRRPSVWTQEAAQKLADHIEKDLMFDGIKAKIKFSFSLGFLEMRIKSSDRGQHTNANRLRVIRAPDLYYEHVKR
jgi:hypothetical protein